MSQARADRRESCSELAMLSSRAGENGGAGQAVHEWWGAEKTESRMVEWKTTLSTPESPVNPT
jgi:hypothetical protein